MADFNSYSDTIDVRDIIARVEALEHEIEAAVVDGDAWIDDGSTLDEGREELASLSRLLDDLKGYGGDEEWRGDWYPITLIRDSYFEDYAEELAEDIGAIDHNARWPLTHIDWEAAARALQVDYGTVEFDGTTFWYR